MKKNQLFVGITIDKFNGIRPSTLLKIVSKIGLEFVEITQSVFDDLNLVKKFVGEIRTGLHLPNIADCGYDFSNDKHEEEIQRIIELINEHHQDLNIKYCLSHPPENKDHQFPDAASQAYLLNNLKKVKPPIILENIQAWDEKEFNDFYREAQEVLGNKLVGQCFDAPHYLLRGKRIDDVFNEFNGDIRCVHLSDFKKNYDAHLPFGKGGQLPVDDILKKLKMVNYNGFINLELLPRSSKDIKPLIDSYLKVIGAFSYGKYLSTKIRLIVFSPLLRKTMKDAFKK